MAASAPPHCDWHRHTPEQQMASISPLHCTALHSSVHLCASIDAMLPSRLIVLPSSPLVSPSSTVAGHVASAGVVWHRVVSCAPRLLCCLGSAASASQKCQKCLLSRDPRSIINQCSHKGKDITMRWRDGHHADSALPSVMANLWLTRRLSRSGAACCCYSSSCLCVCGSTRFRFDSPRRLLPSAAMKAAMRAV